MVDLRIDISDWADEANHEEVAFGGIDDLIQQHVQEGWTPTKAGRMAVAARAMGRADDNILPENKLLLNSGAAVAVSSEFASRTKKAVINGKERTIREFVGSVNDEADHAYVKAQSVEAVRRARAYLLKAVPGHVEGRLSIIAANGGNVREEADALKAKIDALVAEIEA